MRTSIPEGILQTQAGRFSKYKTSLDCQQQFSPGKYCFGASGVQVSLDENERLHIEDEDLRNWITEDLGLLTKRWDLPYRGL